jgi:hypothetical protein
MKFQAAALCLLMGGASAFSPKAFVPNKSGLMVPQGQENGNIPLFTRPNMVAGGAERAYGQEYYEGM